MIQVAVGGVPRPRDLKLREGEKWRNVMPMRKTVLGLLLGEVETGRKQKLGLVMAGLNEEGRRKMKETIPERSVDFSLFRLIFFLIWNRVIAHGWTRILKRRECSSYNYFVKKTGLRCLIFFVQRSTPSSMHGFSSFSIISTQREPGVEI
jgi:hypothetical protein